MEIKPEFVQQLINYLITKPYAEVYQFINLLVQPGMPVTEGKVEEETAEVSQEV